jgi:AGZA family xanthine/uracil permease-like MFS transporter
MSSGGFVAPVVRRITPRAALLGTLAGVSITFISMRPALEIYMTPVIGLTCFAVIMVAWFGGFKYPKGIPAGLIAIAVGMIIAWGSNVFGLGYRKYQDGLQLRTYNEIFVLEEDNPAFEYVNCHPRTGLLPYFESLEYLPNVSR